MNEIAKLSGTQMKCATTKNPQTTSNIEGTHASIKTTLKTASGDYWLQWHKCFSLAGLENIITYHSSLGGELSRIVHERVHHNIFDHDLRLNFNPKTVPTTGFAGEFLLIVCRKKDSIFELFCNSI